MVANSDFGHCVEVLRIFLHSHSRQERFVSCFVFLSQCHWLSIKVYQKWTVKSTTQYRLVSPSIIVIICFTKHTQERISRKEVLLSLHHTRVEIQRCGQGKDPWDDPCENTGSHNTTSTFAIFVAT